MGMVRTRKGVKNKQTSGREGGKEASRWHGRKISKPAGAKEERKRVDGMREEHHHDSSRDQVEKRQ